MKKLEEGQIVDGIHVWRGRMKFRVIRTFWDNLCEAVMAECEILEGKPLRHDSEWRRHELGDIITILPAHVGKRRGVTPKVEDVELANDEINV